MARLESAEKAWLEKRFHQLTGAALEREPTLPLDKIPNDADLKAHDQRMAIYNANPVRPVLAGLQSKYHVKIKEVKPNGELVLQSDDPNDKLHPALFMREFKALKEKHMGLAIDGPDFDFRNIEGIAKIPGINSEMSMNDVVGMATKPGSIVDMFNPLNWITSIWSIAWSVARQIPIVDDFGGAVKEMLSGREFSMKNGKMRQAAERMFSYLAKDNPQAYAAAVDNIMAEYVAEQKKPILASKPAGGTRAAPVPPVKVGFLDVPTGHPVSPSPLPTGRPGEQRGL